MTDKDRAEIYVLQSLLEGDEDQAQRILNCFEESDRTAFAQALTRLQSLVTPVDVSLPAPRHSTESAAAPVLESDDISA